MLAIEDTLSGAMYTLLPPEAFSFALAVLVRAPKKRFQIQKKTRLRLMCHKANSQSSMIAHLTCSLGNFPPSPNWFLHYI